MPLTTQSILRVDVPPQEQDRMIDSYLAQLERTAEQEFKEGNFTIRDLVPSDLPGYTNEEFTETSGSDNAYATTTGGDGTAIADDTILMIWGLQIFTTATSPIITVFRFTVGASLRSQVNLYPLWPVSNTGTAVGDVFFPKMGMLMTPIIVTKQQILKIEEFTIEATTAYIPLFHGAVAEKQGKTLEA